jgi:hypothetical protein
MQADVDDEDIMRMQGTLAKAFMDESPRGKCVYSMGCMNK